MNKFFSFFAVSNRYKHLIGGFIVATLAGSFYAAVYAAIVAASCLELKDHLYGNSRDWTDWLCTLLSGIYVFKMVGRFVSVQYGKGTGLLYLKLEQCYCQGERICENAGGLMIMNVRYLA